MLIVILWIIGLSLAVVVFYGTLALVARPLLPVFDWAERHAEGLGQVLGLAFFGWFFYMVFNA